MNRCPVCQQSSCKQLIDFGELPICHHFLSEGETEGRHRAELGQCQLCGLVQMTTPIPPSDLVPRFDWIAYNEPEAHLDSLVDMLRSLPNVTNASRIGGLTYKEDSTLRRFQERGFVNVWRADAAADLGVTGARGGIETIQAAVAPAIVPQLQSGFRKPQLVLVRHVLEHTHDTLGFVSALKEWGARDGYLVFEIPDCQRAFDYLDYTTLWEDHSLYFTEHTLIATLQRCQLQVIRFETYRSPYENCLVAVAQKSQQPPAVDSALYLHTELARGQRFADQFHDRRQRVRRELESWQTRGRIALFGAGHQAVMFVNLMEVADLIDFVVDDHPQKCGRKLPGSRLPILPSASLYSQGIRCCLSSLGFESEQRILSKHRAFREQGGTFVSIFPIRPDEPLHVVGGKD